MPLSPGARLGSYHIVAPLGAGGMGEVYRATDTNLGRQVAIKILPLEFAADAERVARFEREARTLASLNHPHIAQVYGIEQDAAGPGFSRAIVMELVDGEELSQRIARGPIPLDEALPIARQIAEALEAAHEIGVIHRDLKPANIKVRADGTVKVLDFGLAKAGGAGRAGGAGKAGRDEVLDSPTITTPAVTMHGVILGTAAYMAPEQAKGKPVDRRADIWAFGCVFYEMLTGQRAFPGEDVTDTIAAVVSKEPDWSVLPASTPPAVTLLLRRCLEKRAPNRVPHIGVARLEFDTLAAAPTPHQPAALPAHQRAARIATLLAVAVVAAAVAGAGAWALASRSAPADAPTVYRSTLLIRDSDLTGAPPSSRFAISPDGRYLAYVGTDGEDTRLYVRALDSLDARAVPRSDGAAAPFWSPDSREVAFFSGLGLQAAAAAGGEPRTILARRVGRIVVGGAWSESGILVALGGRLATVPSSGGPLTTLLEPDSAADEVLAYPHFLPGGRRFLYVAFRGLMPTAVYVSSLDHPASRTRIMDGGSNVQYANGYLLFLRSTVLMAQRFDPATGSLAGEPVAVGEALMPNVAVPFGGAFSASRTGAIVYQQLRPGEAALGNTLVWRTRNGSAQPMRVEKSSYRSITMGPNPGQALVGRLDDRGGGSLWLLDPSREVLTRFTFGRENAGVFTPDGTTVIYNSERGGRLELFRKRVEAGAAEEAIPAGEEDRPRTPLSVSRDGKLLLFGSSDLTTGNNLWQVALDGSAPATPFLAGESEERWGQFSPDGRWIVYESDESGRREIYVRAFSGGGTLTHVSPNGGAFPRWSRDGAEIYFYSSGMLQAASVRPGANGLDVASVTPLFDATPPSGFRRLFYDVAADGRFLMIADTAAPGPTQVTMVLNWPELLRGTQ